MFVINPALMLLKNQTKFPIDVSQQYVLGHVCVSAHRLDVEDFHIVDEDKMFCISPLKKRGEEKNPIAFLCCS